MIGIELGITRRGGAASGGASLLTGLLSYWKLEEAAGATRVDSVGSNNLTDSGTVGSGTGKQGNCGVFASGKHLVKSGMTWTATSGLTIACWFKTTVNASYNVIVGSASGYGAGNTHLSVGRGGTADIYFTTNTEAGGWAKISAEYRDANWHFVAAWYDPAGGGTLNIQVDDGAVTTGTTGPDVPTPGTAFYIGQFGGGGFNLTGSIDEFGIWERVLTGTERTYLYNGSNGRTHPFS